MKSSLLMYKRLLTMQMRRKLNVFAILTFVGVVLVTVSFVSPGWIIFRAETHYFDFFRDPDLHSEEANLSAGLWYFSLCYHGSDSRGTYKDDRKVYIEPARRNECQMDTYTSNTEPFVAKTFLNTTSDWLLTTRILSSICVLCAFLGFIGTVVFTWYMGRSRRAGLLACISLAISGGTYLAAVVKTITSTPFSQQIIKLKNAYGSVYVVDFYCPWSLILGGLGCLLLLISAFGHLCILSRNKPNEGVQVYHIHKGTHKGVVSQHFYTIVVPSGHHAAVGLKIPLIESMEKNESKE